MGSIQGQVALVTGSSRGIGKAIAEELGTNGMKVVVNYARSAAAAEKVAAGITGRGGQAIAVGADVGTFDGARRLVGQALERFGQVDVLVNNAGITRDRTLRRMSEEDWREVMRINLDSVFYCTKAVLEHMIERRHGRIINVSSVIGEMGNIGQANYAASKAGMIGFAKAAALELAQYGITVNAICPGFVESDMLEEVPEQIRARLLERIPLRRFANPGEVARGVLYLLGDADYMTGQTLDLNGGLFSMVR